MRPCRIAGACRVRGGVCAFAMIASSRGGAGRLTRSGPAALQTCGRARKFLPAESERRMVRPASAFPTEDPDATHARASRRSGRRHRDAGAGRRPRSVRAQPRTDGQRGARFGRRVAAARQVAQVPGHREAAGCARRGRHLLPESGRGRGVRRGGHSRRARHQRDRHARRSSRDSPDSRGPRRSACSPTT